MGINGLKTLVTKYAPDSSVKIPLTEFSGRRIAIDSEQWIKANISTVRKKIIYKTDIPNEEPNQREITKELINNMINLVIKLLRYGITPIFVFDGKHPEEKQHTKEKRHAAKLKTKEKIDSLYTFLSNNPAAPNRDDVIAELRKNLCNYTYIPREDYFFFREVVKSIGVPYLLSNVEAEALCSALCIEGKVAAVYSTDTDNLAYGCPLMIEHFSKEMSLDTHQFDCIRLDFFLKGLQIPHELFVDLCIMCGCDYNVNIRGIGPINSYNELLKCRSIDCLSNTYDITCLNHNTCRKIFTYTNSDLLIDRTDINLLNIDPIILQRNLEFLYTNNIRDNLTTLGNLYRNIGPPIEGHIRNIVPVPRYHYLNISQKLNKKPLRLNII